MKSEESRLSAIDAQFSAYFSARCVAVCDEVYDHVKAARWQAVNAVRSRPVMYGGGVDSNTATVLTHAGEWQAQDVEEIYVRTKRNILLDSERSTTLAAMAVEWETAARRALGDEKVAALETRLGRSLSTAWLDEQLDKAVLEQLTQKGIPQDRFDYVLRYGISNSLIGELFIKAPRSKMSVSASELGGSQSVNAEAIEQEALARYGADRGTRRTADALAVGIDLTTTLPIDIVLTKGKMTLGRLAMWTGLDMAFQTGSHVMEDAERSQAEPELTATETVAMLIEAQREQQRQVAHAQLQADRIRTRQQTQAARAEYQAAGFGEMLSEEFAESIDLDLSRGMKGTSLLETAMERDFRTVGTAPESAGTASGSVGMPPVSGFVGAGFSSDTVGATLAVVPPHANNAMSGTGASPAPTESEKTTGWASLLGRTHWTTMLAHLGVLLAQLPDLLVDMLSGKSPTLRLHDNLLPVAGILCGSYVDSPTLRATTIAEGAAALTDTRGRAVFSGMEQLLNESASSPVSQPRYKHYDDEPLNARITSRTLSGNCLLLTIDETPCAVTLPERVVAAHAAGALPLNVLCNAMLSHFDNQQQQPLAQAYEAGMQQATRELATMVHRK